MKYLLLLLLLCSFIAVEAQQSSRFRIGVEYGITPLIGKINDCWDFREAGGSYYSQYDNYYENTNVIGDGEIHYMGLKTEFSLPNKRFAITSGLRYNRINERIRPLGNSSARLYLFHPSDQGIDLFRIYGVDESLGYLSVPLELEVVLWGHRSRWQGYVKGGVQAGVKIHGNTKLDFVSKEMEKHKDEILADIGASPSDFSSNAYASFGIRFVIHNKMNLSVENTFPFFLTQNNFSLLTPTPILTGFQFKIAYPINFFTPK
ncbi:MAG: hypothetical protein LBB62_00505 [Proteiniphilum sp.]|jgi:hypothetical protein|nr:hypothetical protein [Proteiniphilum sp.]